MTRCDAFSFHLVTILLHAGSTLLVYAVARRCLTDGRTAAASAALFAAHPIHTEVVDWIAAFPDAFVTAVVLAAFWWFVMRVGENTW